MTKELKKWIDEQVILYLDIWSKVMYNTPINAEDEEWLNRKRSGFEEYIKDVKNEILPIDILKPKEYIPSYIEDIRKRYIQIMMKAVNINIKKSKEYAKKRVEEMYNEKERNV